MPSAARPLAASDLARLPPGAAASSLAVARARARLPDELRCVARGVGEIVVRPLALRWPAPDPTIDAGEALAITWGGEPGRLVVDLALAQAVLSALTGLPRPLALRPLGLGERGLLAAVVAAALQELGATRAVVSPREPDAIAAAVVVELAVRAAAATGAVRLELPAAALSALTAGPPRMAPAAIAVRVALELARTELPAPSWASARPGDAVVFEGTSAREPDQPWPVLVRCGGTLVPARLSPGGALVRDGALDRRPPEPAVSGPSGPSGPLTPEAAQLLAEAPVEVVAELGRLVLRGDELVGLLAGAVLPLGLRAPVVQLRAGGRPWATGELVTVGDELAVRITAVGEPRG